MAAPGTDGVAGFGGSTGGGGAVGFSGLMVSIPFFGAGVVVVPAILPPFKACELVSLSAFESVCSSRSVSECRLLLLLL